MVVLQDSIPKSHGYAHTFLMFQDILCKTDDNLYDTTSYHGKATKLQFLYQEVIHLYIHFSIQNSCPMHFRRGHCGFAHCSIICSSLYYKFIFTSSSVSLKNLFFRGKQFIHYLLLNYLFNRFDFFFFKSNF